MSDIQTPKHYTQGDTDLEAIDIIEHITADYQPEDSFVIGNALKYIIRAPHKGNLRKDIKKAVQYLRRFLYGPDWTSPLNDPSNEAYTITNIVDDPVEVRLCAEVVEAYLFWHGLLGREHHLGYWQDLFDIFDKHVERKNGA